MYLEHFGFNREPFHITPDPDFLFLTPSHKEALASIEYGVEKRKGFIAVTGEVGLGKTTIIRTFLQQRDRDKVKAIVVLNLNITFRAMLKTIYRGLGIDVISDNVSDLVSRLQTILVEEYIRGNNVVLVMDEAQNIPLEILEKLRMLSNIETSREKLIQVLMIGQPEFEATLNRKELRQLRQRVAVRATLEPLSRREAHAYIRHRLDRSLISPETDIFDKGALKRIVKYSTGVPRKINILCDNALITAFGYGSRVVTGKIVREVADDLKIEERFSACDDIADDEKVPGGFESRKTATGRRVAYAFAAGVLFAVAAAAIVKLPQDPNAGHVRMIRAFFNRPGMTAERIPAHETPADKVFLLKGAEGNINRDDSVQANRVEEPLTPETGIAADIEHIKEDNTVASREAEAYSEPEEPLPDNTTMKDSDPDPAAVIDWLMEKKR